MPDSALPDDTVLTSSFYDTYIREQVVVTCTSGTRPSAVEGRMIYETDTDSFVFYTGSAWKYLTPHTGQFSDTTTAAGSLVVTHGAPFTPFVVVLQPISPNGASAADRWTSWNVTSVSSSTFTIGRCVSQDGTILASTAVVGRFIALP